MDIAQFSHTVKAPDPGPAPPPFAAPCAEHTWELGNDACVTCGQSWRELYETVAMEIRSDGSFTATVRPR